MSYYRVVPDMGDFAFEACLEPTKYWEILKRHASNVQTVGWWG